MNLVRRIALLLRALLVLAFLAMLMLQFLSFPGQFRYEAQQGNISQTERWVLTLLVGALFVCFEIIIVSTWVLLGRVLKEEIFRSGSLQWVDAILGALAAAWLLVAIPVATTVPQWDDPGGPILFLVVLLIGAVVGLVMVVMRALLQQATMLRADLDVVI